MTRNAPPSPAVYGQRAPSPRLTRAGAALIALALAVPGGTLIGLLALVL